MKYDNLFCPVCETELGNMLPLDSEYPEFLPDALNVLVCRSCAHPAIVEMKDAGVVDKVIHIDNELMAYIKRHNRPAFESILRGIEAALTE